MSGLLLGAVYALFSSGLTLIWGMMNVVNFAHGDFVMLGMYTAVRGLDGAGRRAVRPPCRSPPYADRDRSACSSYFLLVRHIMKGPMLAQILGTFGLALFLRYVAFWYFGANFKTLPDTSGRPLLRARRHPLRGLARCWPARSASLVTLAAASDPDAHRARQPHAGGLGGRDGGAAHGHPARSACRRSPGRWPAAATGIAGALIATFFYTSPTVGETLAIVAFVTVSFGGFGSVLGALVAGLIIGVVESLSAYLIGPVYKDVIVYMLFVLVLWFRPQGLMGKA